MYYLDRQDERADYEDLLNNPAVNILDKHFDTETETTYEGDVSSSTQRPYVRVEYEICSL